MRTHTPGVQGQGERGVALVAVLLLLMMMSALGMALAINGETETLIARNQISGMQAHAAAEAGLNHGAEVITDFILGWQLNGFASSGLAVDAVLASADSGTGLSFNSAEILSADLFTSTMILNTDLLTRYQIEVTDDEDNGPGEDGDALHDANGAVVIRATGFARDGAKVVLEALITAVPQPALLVDGDMELAGNAAVEGIHTNGDLSLQGSATVSGDATASGDIEENCDGPCDVAGTKAEGASEMEVPEVNASDYLGEADYLLTSTGTIVNQSTGLTVCNAQSSPCLGWEFDVGSGTWSVEDADPGKTYYVEGNVEIGSNDDLDSVSIIAEGDVDIDGGPDWTPDPDATVMLVTDGDLYIHGNPDMGTFAVQGTVMVKGQLDIHGNATIHGQVVVADEDVGNLASENVIQGSVSLEYSGGGASATFTVTGWRDVRDAD
jgi:cytoskeletal protein CcmA (bactofilin family)